MRKKTRLSERPGRLPGVFSSKLSDLIEAYLSEAPKLPNESSKATRFAVLLSHLSPGASVPFIEDYLKGLEKPLKAERKGLVLRGRVDNLYGNLVIEFESDLKRSLSQAQDQLRLYFSLLWRKEEKEVSYLALATDGLDFRVYVPKLKAEVTEPSPDDILLTDLEKVDFRRLELEDIYFWIDRHFFRQRKPKPTSEEFVADFGSASPAFAFSLDALGKVWYQNKGRSDNKVIFETWEKYLRIAYGSLVANDELFLRHTYLATLSKLLVWQRLTGLTAPPSAEELVQILSGDFFQKKGFGNFLEEDFFSWVVREPEAKVGLATAKKLINQLANYNLRELSEDVLKGLYQELVDPAARHDLGEYYTPDWLAQGMVEKALSENPKASVLDPSCGSGTFLYQALRFKRKALGSSQEALNQLVASVVGIDIHPLAVIISKANYLLALGELLFKRKGPLNIPVYMANSIRPPVREVQHRLSLDGEVPSLSFKLDDKKVSIPEALISDSQVYDQAIEALKSFALEFKGKGEVGLTPFLRLLEKHVPALAEDPALREGLFPLALTLRELIEAGRDTIWAFVLKNLYKPLFLKGRFDVVIGNPPWLSYRYVEKGEYQVFLKENITKGYRLVSRAELLTHMELGTFFFLRAAELYLKKDGLIAFVLPRSVFTSDQHEAFRSANFVFPVPIGFVETWDLERVKPLFKVPACVFFARKGEKRKVLIPCTVYEGTLPRKNASAREAEKALTLKEKKLRVVKQGRRSFLSSEGAREFTAGSDYRKSFREGATLVPRGFWFVEVKSVPSLGLDLSQPQLCTSSLVERMAKEAYKGLALEGNVESEFLYGTLLSTDLVPFGHLPYRMVVLPIRPKGSGFEMIKADQARGLGSIGLARWLELCEGEWKSRRGEKAGKLTIYESLDYRRKLTIQNRHAKYRVLYPMSATYLCSCVVENKPIQLNIEGQELVLKGFVADYVCFDFATDNAREAYYLSAILNSKAIDDLIKPMQSRGLFGPRHICKKIWELPIPLYSDKKPTHRHLAELGEKAHDKAGVSAKHFASQYHGIGHIRGLVRVSLKKELAEIDALTKSILKGH